MYKLLAVVVIMAAIAHANAAPAPEPEPGKIWDSIKNFLWDTTKKVANDVYDKIDDNAVVSAIADSSVGEKIGGVIKDIGKKVDDKLDKN